MDSFESVSAAAENGSYLDQLRAMWRVIAAAIDAPTTPPYALSSLIRLGADLSREIEEIEARGVSEAEASLAIVREEDSWDQGAI